GGGARRGRWARTPTPRGGPRGGPGITAPPPAGPGTVEAIELPGSAHWVLGVQWHPERDKDTRVMSALVEAASLTPAVRV
ncbi:gamma-glutamyl-gamma-aminobutyrate hydrolase family protein, partial [Streptomyces sp. NPDC059456]|uniref:gamma-glutamyl-gamma-aminobutyrate hydrolase family protein n=1 Tax=Streptomyces sp. NPDC059456 TaxID=3346838 RepID=UPI0036B31E5E